MGIGSQFINNIKILSLNSPLGVTQTIKPMNSLNSGTHDTSQGENDKMENKALGIKPLSIGATSWMKMMGGGQATKSRD